MEDRGYKLRPHRRKIKIPIQIHVLGKNMLDSQTIQWSYSPWAKYLLNSHVLVLPNVF